MAERNSFWGGAFVNLSIINHCLLSICFLSHTIGVCKLMARSSFTQSELALMVAQFCSAPEITATYSACACYDHWFKMSNVRDILPVLWNIDHVGEIVLCYMKSCYDSGHSESDEESLYGDDLKEVEEAKDQHVATCISLYMRYYK